MSHTFPTEPPPRAAGVQHWRTVATLKGIPDATVARLPVYLRSLNQLAEQRIDTISSGTLAEAAGVNSAAGSFGLSFGLALAGAVMMGVLALTFTSMAESSAVLSPEEATQVATALDEDAQLMSDAQLQTLMVGQPPDVQAEIVRINQEARPMALQAALLVPLIAGLLGLGISLLMRRQPDVKPSAAAEGLAFG